ncbi:MAG: FadD3 family acyl-CoA ligase [Actinomycetota bacterium]
MTIPEMVRSSAHRFGDRDAIVEDNKAITFARLADQMERAASACIAAGLQRGDRAAIWAPNISEWIVAALGIHAAGGILVPINTRFKGNEARYILERSDAKLLFTVNGFLDSNYVEMLRDAGCETPATIILRGELPAGTISWSEFNASGKQTQMSDPEGDDLSDIIFTSGTTGKPKGVMSTHAQSLRVFETWSRLVGLQADDRYLIVNPFFHTFGYKAGFLSSIMRGAAAFPHAVFDPNAVLERIQSERISVLPGPPTLYQSMLNHPKLEEFDLSSLRLAVTGAAVVPVSLIERMHSKLGFETVLTAYGLTESTGTATMCKIGDDARTIANTSGCAIPETEVKVVDDNGFEMKPGEPGEVVVRGYNVMRGYLDDPEQTREAIDENGWLHTGDIGVMDERGYLKITDRKKDMFIVGGFNAYPAEIENDLLRYEGVAQAAVIGAPDERLGEVGVAFVIPRAGATIDPEALIAWSRENMANYKVPRRVIVTDSLPMNASGKVLKYELRKLSEEAT